MIGSVKKAVRALVRHLPEDTVVRVLTGPLRGQRWLVRSGTNGCWVGTYERETQQLFRGLISAGDVIFDIGANVGFLALLASRLTGRNGKVFAFEPLPRNLRFLERHVTLNAVHNITVVPLALARKGGTARFRTGGHPSMGGLTSEGELEVRTSSLDELVESGTVPEPSFMKIDIEGGEHEMLLGASSVLARSRPVILLSAHGYQQQELCAAVLEAARYELELVQDGASDGNYVVLARPRP